MLLSCSPPSASQGPVASGTRPAHRGVRADERTRRPRVKEPRAWDPLWGGSRRGSGARGFGTPGTSASPPPSPAGVHLPLHSGRSRRSRHRLCRAAHLADGPLRGARASRMMPSPPARGPRLRDAAPAASECPAWAWGRGGGENMPLGARIHKTMI